MENPNLTQDTIDAAKAAEKAEKDAAKAAEKAEKDAAKAAEKAEKDAAKAARKESTKDWSDVFEVYPDVNEIYVVNDMPFIEQRAADNHSNYTGKPVEVIKR